ncbi:MAG: recombinase family protein [Ruminococcus flavefaciens]|nr:recombinase family protein [Ruminococcus flavefaciens]
MEKVLAYLRYSSHNQDDGNSIYAQTTTIENYTNSHNMEVENCYIDMAKTGRNTNRPQYQQMLEDIKNKNVSAKCIVVRAIDRLHRNAKNQLDDLEWFAKHGIRLISVTDGIDTETETSKLLTTIKAAVAEDFSETLSKNTRAALLECAKQCRHLGGNAPLGYKVNADGFYEIDELKSPIIRDIFSLYLQGMGYDYIINYLKNKGFKTATGNDFTKTSLHTILKNKKYTGTYIYDKSTPKNSEGKRNSHTYKEKYIEIPNGIPAIISEDDFNKVQQKMAGNAKKQITRASKNYYALNGVLYCGECGKAFSGNVNHSNNRRYFQYRGNCQCKVKNIRMDKLNNFVFYAIQQCIFSPDNKDEIMKKINTKLATQRNFQSAEVNALLSKINGIENAQNNLTGYLENGKATETIFNKMQKNETELKILKNQLELKLHEIADIDDETYDRLVSKFMNYMSTIKSPEAVALRNATIKNIEINESDVTIEFNSGITINNETVQYFNDNMEE